MTQENTHLISTAEAAKMFGVSRVTIFKWIKAGKLPAQKIGRNYLIHLKDVAGMAQAGNLTDEQKELISEAVVKAMNEYLEVFRLLGKE